MGDMAKAEEHRTSVRTIYEVVLSIHVTEDADVEPGELEAAAEAVLDAVQREVPTVAFGPVASVDFNTLEIEILCQLEAENPEDLHSNAARVSAVMLEAANAFEYSASSIHRLEPALA
jgi:hypothetical protein